MMSVGDIPRLGGEGEVRLARDLVHDEVVADLADRLDGRLAGETGRLKAVDDVATADDDDVACANAHGGLSSSGSVCPLGEAGP
jgi:hypothetical protein